MGTNYKSVGPRIINRGDYKSWERIINRGHGIVATDYKSWERIINCGNGL